MNNHHLSNIAGKNVFVAAFVFGCLWFLAGCTESQKPRSSQHLCPPKTSVSQSITALRAGNRSIFPLKAVGTCSVDFSGQSRDGFKQNFPVRIWYAPVGKLAMFGEVLFDPQALCFGVSGEQFWSYSKHFDVYYHGQSNGIRKIAGGGLLDIRPQILLQILDPARAISRAEKLYRYGPFDVLTAKAQNGTTTKVFIERCQYLVSRIEYIDFTGQLFFAAEMRDYKVVKGGRKYKFPSRIVVESYKENSAGRLEINLNRTELWQPNQAQLKSLFDKPKSKGFGNVYQVTQQGQVLRETK
ncbi:MAG: hypothetical protein K8R02_07065 [Anaerohalosphaeraceae bacterium]|nr:hypothetical protein [Anaerohalosphaeraceae bacterium]